MEMAVRMDRGTGHPLVFLHGFPGNGADWERVAESLSDDHRTLVVDLLGFGSSPQPRTFDALWVDAQADALAATLDRLGLRQVALIAHDYGGPIAVTFLDRYPERVTHFAVMSTNTFGDTPVDLPLSLLKLPGLGPQLDRVFFSAASLAMLGRIASRTRGIRPARNDAREARTIRTIFGPVLRKLDALYAEVETALGEISVPTVVLWGDRDPFFSLDQGQRTAAAIPGATFIPLIGAGHFVPIERPDAVVDAVRELVSGSDITG